MELLKNEQQASDLVSKIGLVRAKRLLTALSNRKARRTKALPDCVGFLSHNYQVSKQWEIELAYKLKLGIMITDNSNSPQAARQRNLERRRKRKEARLATA